MHQPINPAIHPSSSHFYEKQNVSLDASTKQVFKGNFIISFTN
jgi:hypothetical protein